MAENSKKGFTLIELLAVILILGIIALIAVPVVNNIINESKRGNFKSTVQNVLKAVETKCQVERLKGDAQTSTYTFSNAGVSPALGIKGKLPTGGTITVDNDCNATINNVTNGEYCAIIESNNLMISKDCASIDPISPTINAPTYSVSPEGVAESKTVTINYPIGYTNEYSIDGGLTWNTYTDPIVFTENGTIIARITDGTNYVTGNSYTISNIVKLATNVYYNNSTHTNGQDKTIQEVFEELYELYEETI